MSIWCSWEDIGFEDWPDAPKRPNGGQVRSYATGWSNHYPTKDDTVERKASVHLASMPVWCVPGHEEKYDERYGPWLRLGLESWEHDYSKPESVKGRQDATVVMDEKAVRALVEQLQRWLDHPKAKPKKSRKKATS